MHAAASILKDSRVKKDCKVYRKQYELRARGERERTSNERREDGSTDRLLPQYLYNRTTRYSSQPTTLYNRTNRYNSQPAVSIQPYDQIQFPTRNLYTAVRPYTVHNPAVSIQSYDQIQFTTRNLYTTVLPDTV